MRNIYYILIMFLLASIPFGSFAQEIQRTLHFEFCGNNVEIPFNSSVAEPFDVTPTQQSIENFYNALNAANYQPTVKALSAFKEKYQLNDWFFYQLIRKTAQQISPKADNYHRYTLYKWFLLSKSGYDASLAISHDQLRFYVRSDELVYDIPYYMYKGNQYVCLNIHDYVNTDLGTNDFTRIDITIPEAKKAFSYKVTQMPDFTPGDYVEKDIRFDYNNEVYYFKVKLNKEVPAIFRNYPVVDYASYFNIPLSNETYSSLIPALKKNLQGMKQKGGVDFLMRFTRNAFLYETDAKIFGKEKRMSPEQTLINDYSDCDDRAALFFYLVKEIYNLPMIVLVYPTHVTIAVKFDKPVGNTIDYNGSKYSVCEPTPQSEELYIGQLSSKLRKETYEVAYAYEPRN